MFPGFPLQATAAEWHAPTPSGKLVSFTHGNDITPRANEGTLENIRASGFSRLDFLDFAYSRWYTGLDSVLPRRKSRAAATLAPRML